MFQRQGGLDHARDSGGSFGVSQLRLDATQGTPCSVGNRFAKNRAKGCDLGGVSYLRARGMGLEELDAVRRNSGSGVGVSECFGLAASRRRVNRRALAVAGRAHRTDDSVDGVFVSASVGESLQHQDAEAVTDDRAVGGLVERSAIAGGRERRRLAEAHIHKDVVEGVHASSEHHIRASGGELQPGKVEGAQ